MDLSSEDKSFLELYSDSIYEKPSLTVDSVILRIFNEESTNYRKLSSKKLQVFLLKRNWSPFVGYYALPGTFVDLNHELNETMKMCVKNKVNLENFYYEQLFTFGDKSRDPRTRVLSVSYMLLTHQNSVLKNGEWFDIEVRKEKAIRIVNPDGYTQSQMVFVTLKNKTETIENKLKISLKKENLQETKSIDIESSSLAFDHIKMIFFALERLKNKIEYTDIIFNLLSPTFTLTELKLSYELVLDEKLLDANFRRKTSKMVEATNSFVTGKGHRSSQLFKLNPNWNSTNLD